MDVRALADEWEKRVEWPGEQGAVLGAEDRAYLLRVAEDVLPGEMTMRSLRFARSIYA